MKRISILLCLCILFALASCTGGRELFLPEAQNDKVYTLLDENAMTCTLTVRCDEATKSGALSDDKRAVLPEDGFIIAEREVNFTAGESVFDVLLRELKARKIHFDFSETPAYNSKYIKGISNLYELDCGEFSGWLYKVNGEIPSVGYNQYNVKSGDKIDIYYTTDWQKEYE